MASSYQGYARPTSFQQFGPSDAEIRKQQEEDNRKIRALEEQKDAYRAIEFTNPVCRKYFTF